MTTTIASLVADNLDLWTSATQRKSGAGRGGGKRISLYGIERLRALILDLAVRGKLMPQDAGDEPAIDLISQIRNARVTKIKATIREMPIKEVVPIEGMTVPSGWQIASLGQIFEDIHYGYTASADYSLSGIRLLRITDIQNGLVDWHSVPGCQIDEKQALKYLIGEGDIMIARTGGTIGKTYLAKDVSVRAVFASYLIRAKALDPALSPYLQAYFGSDIYWHQLYANSAGTGQPNVNATALKSLKVPLPPLAEQRRIVAKVDELMALCDALERESADAMAAHQALVEALLATLVTSADAAELATNWARLEQHFDTLFATEASIDALKQTILDLAVRGKLVEQDAGDEAASVLLQRIATSNSTGWKDGRNRGATTPPIPEQETPFRIPHDWTWSRFGQIAKVRADLVQSLDFPNAIQIAPDIIEKGTGKLLATRTVSEAGVRGPNSRFYVGQIIYSKIRPSLSKAVIAEVDGLCSADMYPLDTPIDTHFLLKLILSEVFLVQVRIAENRIKMPKLNKESLNNFLVPIPPLAEQQRIVAKVDALMALCDTLKASITDAATTQKHLADAITERAAA